MKISLEKKYEGMGFVEALISIMVVGASSVVLMQIASQTLQEMMQNEVIDTMTQYAVEGGVMVQDLATQERMSEEDVFPDTEGCYVMDVEDGVYSFRKNASEEYISYDLARDRETYKTETEMIADDNFFRLACINSYVGDGQFAIIKVVVGQSKVGDGTITKKNMVKDYSYFTVATL